MYISQICSVFVCVSHLSSCYVCPSAMIPSISEIIHVNTKRNRITFDIFYDFEYVKCEMIGNTQKLAQWQNEET